VSFDQYPSFQTNVPWFSCSLQTWLDYYRWISCHQHIGMQIVCFHQLLSSHILRVHMDIFQIYVLENTCKLRSHLAIPSNHNQNLFGWAKLRSHMAIPFNQNQTLRVLPDGRVWTFFFCFENFLMVRFFSFFFLMIRFDQTLHLMLFFLMILQDSHWSFLIAGLTSILPDDRN